MTFTKFGAIVVLSLSVSLLSLSLSILLTIRVAAASHLGIHMVDATDPVQSGLERHC